MIMLKNLFCQTITHIKITTLPYAHLIMEFKTVVELREVLKTAGVPSTYKMKKQELLDIIQQVGSYFVEHQKLFKPKSVNSVAVQVDLPPVEAPPKVEEPTIPEMPSPAKEYNLEELVNDEDLLYNLYSKYRRDPHSVVEEVTEIVKVGYRPKFGDVISIYKVYPELDGVFLWDGKRALPLTVPEDLKAFPALLGTKTLLPDHWSRIENFPQLAWIAFGYFRPELLKRLQFVQRQVDPYKPETQVDIYESFIKLPFLDPKTYERVETVFRFVFAVKPDADPVALLRSLKSQQIITPKIFHDHETGVEHGMENDQWTGKNIFMYLYV